jgi:ubiquitin C-terminal hydrolase
LCDVKYELGAVVQFHRNRSHYTAFARRRTGPNTLGWVEYDDSQRISTTEADVLLGAKAYLLFYQQV